MFQQFAQFASSIVGSPQGFSIAFLLILTWAAVGPVFNFSSEWQMIVNTGTTIVTFLLAFLIQYGQNRDSRSLHLKMDELIRAVSGARNQMIDADKAPDPELDSIEAELRDAAKQRP